MFDMNVLILRPSWPPSASLSQDLFSISAYVYAQRPQLDIHSFEGNFTRVQSLADVFTPCQTLAQYFCRSRMDVEDVHHCRVCGQ